MVLYKDLHYLKVELRKVELSEPSNWLGSWVRGIKIKSIKCKISEIESKLLKRKDKH